MLQIVTQYKIMKMVMPIQSDVHRKRAAQSAAAHAARDGAQEGGHHIVHMSNMVGVVPQGGPARAGDAFAFASHAQS
jgi:hypothetical protein